MNDSDALEKRLIYAITRFAEPSIVRHILKDIHSHRIIELARDTIVWIVISKDEYAISPLQQSIITEYCKIFEMNIPCTTDIDVLYACIRISKIIGESIYPYIKQLCDNNNTWLHTPYNSYIPILYAISRACNVQVVRILKDAWWDPKYTYREEGICMDCMRKCKYHKCSAIDINIEMFINRAYIWIRNAELCEKYAALFGVTFTKHNIFSIEEYIKPATCTGSTASKSETI